MAADPTNLAALVEAAVAVTSQPDLGTVLDTMVIRAKEATGARYAALGVLGDHGVLIDFKYLGIDEQTARHIGHLPTGRGVLGTLIRHPEAIRLDDLREHPDSIGFPEHHPVMITFLGVPVRIGATVYGNLYLTEKPGGFTEEDQTMVESLAAIAGAAIATTDLRTRLTQLAVVSDRERIARDLHDAVIQDLFGVGLSLQALAGRIDDPSHAEKLGDAVDRLDEAIRSLRSFVFELHAEDSDPGLGSRLTRFVGGLAVPDTVALDVWLDGELPLVDPALAKDLEHLVHEAVSNAVRHSATDRIEVSLRSAGTVLVLTVADRGGGFDPYTVVPGMGLTTMRERVARWDGEVVIDSSPVRGTVVRFRLPV